jgi:hypothetical protein
MQLNALHGQVLRQFGTTVRSTRFVWLVLASLVLSIGDLLSQSRRHDEVGDLSKGELHLRSVDALALVLSS